MMTIETQIFVEESDYQIVFRMFKLLSSCQGSRRNPALLCYQENINNHNSSAYRILD